MELMMRYRRQKGKKVLLAMDEVTDVLYICSTIGHCLLVDRKQKMTA